MKKVFACIAIIGAIVTALHAGYVAGKNHVIYDQDMFVVELPDRNASGGFDESEITVYTYIDGDCYEYGCNIS